MWTFLLNIPGIKTFAKYAALAGAAIFAFFVYTRTVARNAIKKERAEIKADQLEELHELRDREEEIKNEQKDSRDDILDDLVK